MKKIAVACFIGGTLCCGVALWLAPLYWWLGVFGGLAGGYLSYEFSNVLQAIPIAFKTIKNETSQRWNNLVEDICKWFLCPHPIIYASTITTVLSVLFLGYSIYDTWPQVKHYASSLILIGIITLVIWVATADILELLMELGADKERCYYILDSADNRSKKYLSYEESGYTKIPLTYANATRWVMKGIKEALRILLWTVWWVTFKILLKFVRDLFIFVHKRERVACAINGTIGGVVSFLLLADPAATFPEKVVVTLCGGLIGAAVGVIATKFILHLQVAEKINA